MLSVNYIWILVSLAVIGFIVGQIGKVCYDVLPCGDDEKEKPVFRLKNFNNSISVLFGLPSMLLFPLMYICYGSSIEFLIVASLFIALVPIIAIDYKHYIIPDKLNLFIVFLGVVYIVYFLITSQFDVALNHFLAGLIGGGIFLALALIALFIYKQEGMGFGDIKLMCGLGLLFGIKGILVLTLISFVLGAIICIILLITKIRKMNEYIPFGPFICIAAIILMFVPAGYFVDWYIALLS